MPPTFALYRMVIDLGASLRTVIEPLPEQPRPGDTIELANGIRCVVTEVVPEPARSNIAGTVYATLPRQHADPIS